MQRLLFTFNIEYTGGNCQIDIMIESFIQIFNQDNDPLFVELTTGKAYWILPYTSIKSSQYSSLSRYNFKCVKYLTHLDDRGQPYFEDMMSNIVSWALPSEPIMSNDAKSIVITLQLMNRIESEKAIGEKINEDLATEQMNELDLFFDSLENQRKGKNIDDDSKIINTIKDHNSNNAMYDVNYDANYHSNNHGGTDNTGSCDDSSIYEQRHGRTTRIAPSECINDHNDHSNIFSLTTTSPVPGILKVPSIDDFHLNSRLTAVIKVSYDGSDDTLQ